MYICNNVNVCWPYRKWWPNWTVIHSTVTYQTWKRWGGGGGWSLFQVSFGHSWDMSTKPGTTVMHLHLFYLERHINHMSSLVRKENMSVTAEDSRKSTNTNCLWIEFIECNCRWLTCSWINDNLWVLCLISSVNVSTNRNELFLFVYTGANNSIIFLCSFKEMPLKQMILIHHF